MKFSLEDVGVASSLEKGDPFPIFGSKLVSSKVISSEM